MSEYQQSLFDTEPEPWELDAEAIQLVASIVLAEGPDGTFDYLVPHCMHAIASWRTVVIAGYAFFAGKPTPVLPEFLAWLESYPQHLLNVVPFALLIFLLWKAIHAGRDKEADSA